MSKYSLYLLISLSFLYTLYACKDDSVSPDQPEPVEKTIGVEGGIVATADSTAIVDIEQNTLTQETLIKVEAISETVTNGIGSVYRMSPDGQTFAKPVSITLKYDDTALNNSSADFFRIATRKTGSEWEILTTATLDKMKRTLSVETSHFSDWTIVETQGALNVTIGSLSYTNLPVKVVVVDSLKETQRTLVIATAADAQFNMIFQGTTTAPKLYHSSYGGGLRATLTSPTGNDYSDSKILQNTKYSTTLVCGTTGMADTLFVQLNRWGDTSGSRISGTIQSVNSNGQRSRMGETASLNCTNKTSTKVSVSATFDFIRK
jgi:hypothetical protein